MGNPETHRDNENFGLKSEGGGLAGEENTHRLTH